MWSDPEDI